MTQRLQVLELLRESPGMKWATDEIADVLDLPRKHVCVYVRDLVEHGLACSDSVRARGTRAVYWAPEPTEPHQVHLPNGATLERTHSGWRQAGLPGATHLTHAQAAALIRAGIRRLNHAIQQHAATLGARHPDVETLTRARNTLTSTLAGLPDTPDAEVAA